MTAIEFLEEKLLELFADHLPFELLDEAKEMEKQQIINAYQKGFNNAYFNNPLSKEQYYNETFNK
jgi:hypothetical protein